MLERIKAVVIGHAIGDALGVPVEFCDREELKEKPITEMVGYGSYPVPPGAWSDDTSMSLAALDSLHQLFPIEVGIIYFVVDVECFLYLLGYHTE